MVRGSTAVRVNCSAGLDSESTQLLDVRASCCSAKRIVGCPASSCVHTCTVIMSVSSCRIVTGLRRVAACSFEVERVHLSGWKGCEQEDGWGIANVAGGQSRSPPPAPKGATVPLHKTTDHH